jgi:hypothetical protein
VTFARYAWIVLAVVAVSFGVLWPVLSAAFGERARGAALLGGLLATANTLLAYALVAWSERRSTKVFMGAVLGGMLGRMALLLAAVAALVLWLGLPKVPLATGLLSYFVLFLTLEIAVLHRKTLRTPVTR